MQPPRSSEDELILGLVSVSTVQAKGSTMTKGFLRLRAGAARQ